MSKLKLDLKAHFLRILTEWKNKENPNASPIRNKFGFSLFGRGDPT